MKKNLFLVLLVTGMHADVKAQFPPPAGQPGTTAIHKDSSIFSGWASHVQIIRGWQNIADTTLGKTTVGDSTKATGKADGSVVSLGDGGVAIVYCDPPIKDIPGWDFAIFENGFSDSFLELAFVEVSSDGQNFFRFPAVSYTQTSTQIGGFDTLDATKINNFAGKYRIYYGTPFDLNELKNTTGLDINNITHIRIIDVVGSINPQYATYDQYGNPVNDPWPTPYASGGFDLDAIGFIQTPLGIDRHEYSHQIKAYPNPASHFIHLLIPQELLNNGNTYVEIIELPGGQTLKKLTLNETQQPMNIADIKPGLYLFKITTVKEIYFVRWLKV